MLETLTRMLQDGSSGVVALPLAFLLGLVSALASACCTLPAIGVLVAYGGTRQSRDRRSTALSALWFLLGTTLALVMLGFVAGFVGQAAQTFLGQYWRLFAGITAVVVGIGTLKLFPLPVPRKGSGEDDPAKARGVIGAALGGLILGGGVAACSLPCNPGIFIVLGAAILMGQALWGTLLMTTFAVGFGLPLAAVLFGVSFGKASVKAGKIDAAIRTVAGVILTAAGLYLLATF